VPSEETKPTEAPTETTEGVSVYRNPLTGEVSQSPVTARPVAVVLNNVAAAQPQWGSSQADILYEFPAEAYLSRCVGLYTDIGSVEKLGSVRSARMYFLDIARTYDAVLVHAGGSGEALEAIDEQNLPDIDGIQGYASGTFYRDADRLNAGYALEHTLFTGGEALVRTMEERGIVLERQEPLELGLIFGENAAPEGESANTVKLTFGRGNPKKVTTMTYREELGQYEAAQYGKPWVDAATGNALTFENVLVLFAPISLQDNGQLLDIDLVGEGTGRFACGGRTVPIRWSRSGDSAPFAYTLEDGTPLTLGIGKSYIAVVPEESTVDFE